MGVSFLPVNGLTVQTAWCPLLDKASDQAGADPLTVHQSSTTNVHAA